MTAQARLLGGRYQVGELLGYGGMAEVHRGRDLRLGRDVAIKMLRTDLARDDTFQLRFRREAQNAASLNHPAIVAVYDTGEERGSAGESLPYIVMEFVNGRTLKEVLAAEGRLMPRRALEITAEIAAALDFSHRHGIIHRDIKPGNVMLTQNGQVKVMDFGIARALASGATTMTQTSAVIGPAQYLSPDEPRGEPADARSGVYATGCVLYELLTGHPPFVGDNPVSVAYQHVREDPRPPSTSNRDVPPDIDAVVLKALAKNPMNRYQSAGEMRGDLLRAAAGRPVYATPVMNEDEFATAPVARATPMPRPTGARNTGTMARVPDPRRRKASSFVIAAVTALGVLAVVALTVGVVLANRPKGVTGPKVEGKTDAIARAYLERVKRRLTRRQGGSNTPCTIDTVASQTPAAGQRVREETDVEVQICLGPDTIQMLDLVGVPLANAQQQLTLAGLKVKVEQVDSDKPENEVVETIPKANERIKEGSTVTLRVSKGLKKVPDVMGKTEAEARILIESAGLRVFVLREPADPENLGKVIKQDPPKDTLRQPQTTVRITVGEPREDPTNPPTSPPAGP